MSLYEFCWIFDAYRGKLCRSVKPVCIMVTPAFSADCANVMHDRHEAYARAAVVAYWRLMPTWERHEAIMNHQYLRPADLATTDRRTWGTTEFVAPLGRFLGVQDLVRKFDGKTDRAGKEIVRAQALMEMLVDPMLVAWVPGWVVEQYERWNPKFRGTLRWALQDGATSGTHRAGPPITRTNADLLRVTRRAMIAVQEKREADKAKGKAGDEDSDASSALGSGLGNESEEEDKKENEDPELAATVVAEDRGMVWEALPSADGPDGGVGDDDWERAGVAERLSAAGAASAAADVVLAGSSATAPRGEARVNPPGHVWVSTVSRAMHAKRLEELWAKWKGNEVDDDGDGVSPEDLDPWQKFAHDIAVLKAAERERLGRNRVTQLSGYHPLRLMITGYAGSGKSRTLRASVRSMRNVVNEHGSEMKRKC